MRAYQIEPQFPPSFSELNLHSLDIGQSSIISYSTGSCVHFAQIINNNNNLIRAFSLDVPSNDISSIRFKPDTRVLAFGDNLGRVFIWDIDKHCYLASMNGLNHFGNKSEYGCLKLHWYGDDNDILIGLFKGKKLVGFNEMLEVIWEVNLGLNFVGFDFDKNKKNRFLLFDNENHFAIYQFERSGLEKPTPVLEQVNLATNSSIVDVQWDIHLQDYILIMLEKELFYFNLEAENVVQIIERSIVSSSFSFIIQLPKYHQKIMVCHKNGTISIYKSSEQELLYLLESDFKIAGITSGLVSPYNYDNVIFVHNKIGLLLFSLNLMKIINIDPLYPSDVISYDSDGTKYSIGTNDGYIIIGNLYDTSDLKKFKVSDETVKFVSYDSISTKVYWQTESNLGMVDIGSRNIITYKSHGKILKCFGSHRGALIVQRGQNILGVFMNGKEQPLILQSNILDVSVSEDKSTQSHGRFYVLTKDKIIKQYNYSDNNITPGYGIRPNKQIEGDPISLTYSNSLIVTAFSSGIISYFDEVNETSSKIIIGEQKIRSLQFSNENLTDIFGLCKENTLFHVIGQQVSFCPIDVVNYKVINEQLLLVMTTYGVVKFIQISDWCSLSYLSDYLPLPNENDTLLSFIKNYQENEFYSPFLQDIYFILNNNKNSMKLNSIYGIGISHIFEKFHNKYLLRCDPSDNIKKIRFFTLIMLNEFDKASELLLEISPNENDYFNNSIFSIFLSSIQNGISEHIKNIFQEIGTKFLENEKYYEGMLLFKISKLDEEAINILLNHEQFDLAIKYIRNLDDIEKQKHLLFLFACKLLEFKRYEDSALMFASSCEYHSLLIILFSMRLFIDSYFLMKKLQSNNHLHPMPDSYAQIFPKNDFIEFDSLCTLIEHHYQTIVISLENK